MMKFFFFHTVKKQDQKDDLIWLFVKNFWRLLQILLNYSIGWKGEFELIEAREILVDNFETDLVE